MESRNGLHDNISIANHCAAQTLPHRHHHCPNAAPPPLSKRCQLNLKLQAHFVVCESLPQSSHRDAASFQAALSGTSVTGISAGISSSRVSISAHDSTLKLLEAHQVRLIQLTQAAAAHQLLEAHQVRRLIQLTHAAAHQLEVFPTLN